jgi:cell division protein FtsW
VVYKCSTFFGKLLVVGIGLPIIFQALINMGVAVELFPVTGQTLPLISSGGTSIWMTCLAIGIILSVSAKREELKFKENNEDNPLEILSETI